MHLPGDLFRGDYEICLCRVPDILYANERFCWGFGHASLYSEFYREVSFPKISLCSVPHTETIDEQTWCFIPSVSCITAFRRSIFLSSLLEPLSYLGGNGCFRNGR
jgi:hypothetical protein